MTGRTPLDCLLVALMLGIGAGCAASPGGGDGPDPSAGPGDGSAPVEVVREPDPTPRERWASPFAVNSVGRVTPVEPRRILIVGSDPAIAAGLAEQRLIELGPRYGEPEVPGATPGGGANGAGAGANGAPDAAALTPIDEINTRVHVVQRGETWATIGSRYGVTSSAMADANPGVDPARLRAGQQLMVPADGRSTGAEMYLVVSGDTLSEIAVRYNVSLAALRRVNGLNGDQLRVGQRLSIPAPGR